MWNIALCMSVKLGYREFTRGFYIIRKTSVSNDRYLIWTLCKDQKSLARMVSDSYQTSYVWLVSPKNKKMAISFDVMSLVAMVTTGGYSALKTALILLKLTHIHHIFI